MNMVRLSIITLTTVVFLSSFTRSYSPSIAYIQTYSELAIVEMNRSGIPASITLAQGILESQNGASKLAQNANNHFGIKCKKYWQGETYYHQDDDYDDNGKLIQSCFRAYDSVIDSYVDHTNFLKQSANYQELFSYSKTDYYNWAIGLKKCGYATDPQYGHKLVKIIEQKNLAQYDHY